MWDRRFLIAEKETCVSVFTNVCQNTFDATFFPDEASPFFDSFTCNLLQLGFYSRLVPPSFLTCFSLSLSLSKSLSCRQPSLPFLSIQIMMVCYDGLSQLSVYLPYAINLPIGTSEKRFFSFMPPTNTHNEGTHFAFRWL